MGPLNMWCNALSPDAVRDARHGGYSKEEIIQRRELFVEICFMQSKTILVTLKKCECQFKNNLAPLCDN